MTVLVEFSTPRLTVQDWQPTLDSPARRKTLERDLSGVLTDRVLAHLPPTLQLDQYHGRISSWIDARSRESDVLLVTRRDTKELLGLMLLFSKSEDPQSVHVGYLLAEMSWGHGYASELLAGLVAELNGKGPLRLVGGVDPENTASARVLEKAGFKVDQAVSAPDAITYVCAIA